MRPRTKVILLLALITGLATPVASAEPARAADATMPIIMTVRGPVPAAELGVALTHEHVLVDWIGAADTGPHRWDAETVAAAVRPNLDAVRAAGAAAFFDCSPAYLGRDPELLRDLSEATGLHVVTNAGWYGAAGGRFVPAVAHDLTPRQIADRWTAEWRGGIGGTGIRPGFVKIGVNGKRPTKAEGDTPATAGERDPSGRFWMLNAVDRKLAAAAAITHRNTGLAVACHTADADVTELVRIFAQHDAPPDALVWVHAQRRPVEDGIELAKQGVWISYDHVSDTRTDAYVERITAMKEAGVLHRLLLSHDSGWYTAGEPGGGERIRGYTALFDVLLPALRERGVLTNAEIDRVLVKNPAAAFGVRP